jgi:4-carboxymuconolactone decarboxylase
MIEKEHKKVDQDRTNKRRFEQIQMEQLEGQARTTAEDIMKFSSVGLGGPYNVMFRSPIFAQRMKHLLDYLRFESSLPMSLNEFAILIQGYTWKSQVEWFAHYPIALKAGLAQSIADDLKSGIRPRDMNEQQVSDALFLKAKSVFSEQQLVDLMAVSGTYVTVAMLLSLGQELPPEGQALPFD